MRDALSSIDRAWAADGHDPLRIDFTPPAENPANHLRGSLTAAAPTPVAADVVLTDNELTRASAVTSVWTDSGVVAVTQLRLLFPADVDGAELTPDLPYPVEGRVSACVST